MAEILFYKKDLIAISGYSRRTFYRRLKEANANQVSIGYYINVDTALKIATALQFQNSLQDFINHRRKAS